MYNNQLSGAYWRITDLKGKTGSVTEKCPPDRIIER
jgi:hypothetical protein